jgi:non-specific serine/threonine protein kinase
VPSLPAPPLDYLPPPEELGGYAAVVLFVARAQERRADFALTAQNARAVAAVCARLDGMPLAIELAAARVGSLPVEAIVARLDDRFKLLTTGPRTAVPRQQTLRATLAWSYDLLSEPEQRLLHQLAVFAGGWTLAAAEAVCSSAAIEGWEVLDLLGSLVNKSLVLLEEAGPAGKHGRYRLLETVREYGLEQLAAAWNEQVVRNRHLAYFLALAEEAEPALQRSEPGQLLDRLEREHDNLRAALEWTLESGERPRARERAQEWGVQAERISLGARLAAALLGFWETRGYLSEGQAWLEAVLARDDAGGSATGPRLRAKALNAAAWLAFRRGDGPRATTLYEECLTLCRRAAEPQGLAEALRGLGCLAIEHGEVERSEPLLEQSLALFRELADTQGVARVLNNLGSLAMMRGEYERARALVEGSLALHREHGDAQRITYNLGLLGTIAIAQGDFVRALVLLEDGLARCRAAGDTRGDVLLLTLLGELAVRQGDYWRAKSLYQESLSRLQTMGATPVVASALEGLGWVAGGQGQPARCARLLAAAAALREALGTSLPPSDQGIHDWTVTAARAALGDDWFAAAWAAGRVLPVAQAIAEALAPEGATENLRLPADDPGAREQAAHQGHNHRGG